MKQPETIKEVLEAMDEKFSDPSTWTQGWYYKDAHGQRSSGLSSATCWCLSGCIIAVSPPESINHLYSEIGIETHLFLGKMLNQSVPTWNDAPNRTFQDVKDLIQRAKEQAP